MLNQVERDALWLQEPTASCWSDDLGALPPLGVAKRDAVGLFGPSSDGLLDKLNDDKLARDVEDLSAIFEELEGGVVDFALPCDEDDVATGAEVTGDWIGDLDKDVVNVDELSSMFDALESAAVETSDDDDEAMDGSDEEYDDDDEVEDEGPSTTRSISLQIVPAPPTWATAAPLDPRSLIRTPVFKNLDSRIPRVEMPRMDLGFGAPSFTLTPTAAVPSVRSTLAVSPKPFLEKKKAVAAAAAAAAAAAPKHAGFKHDPASCWICKSDKSAYKKYALHRYLEKRHRRNWKRGPRYSGRSNVATNRVREGGRFITTAHWV